MTERYLHGRAAWVIGGASGMGRAIAIAIALAEAGANVAVGSLKRADGERQASRPATHIPTEAEFEDVTRAIESAGQRALALPLDVRSDESAQAFFNTAIAAFGKLDILVNAAGTTAHHAMLGHPDDLWHGVIDTNLTGSFRTIKLCLPGMIERRWGRIINIASTAARAGGPDWSAYCASKAGLVGLTRCVALEGAAHGVTCNAINPGWVDTPQSRESAARHFGLEAPRATVDAYRSEIIAKTPQRRLIDPVNGGAKWDRRGGAKRDHLAAVGLSP